MKHPEIIAAIIFTGVPGRGQRCATATVSFIHSYTQTWILVFSVLTLLAAVLYYRSRKK